MIDTAMILAAGRGERMRPLTDSLPKPLLEVGGKSLIARHLEGLAKAGFKQVVINHAWLGKKIEAALGDGSSWGLRIRYSAEEQALETAGGIAQAMPLLGSKAFLVISADIFCDFDLSRAHFFAQQIESARAIRVRPAMRAYCVMVPNAPHHPHGDFAVRHGALVRPSAQSHNQVSLPQETPNGLTFSGIAVYHPSFFENLSVGQKMPIRPLLEKAVDRTEIGAEFHPGRWSDIGTTERLEALRAEFKRP